MSIESLPVPEAVNLHDGMPLTIRPIQPDDSPRLQALHSRLSPESIYLRFLGMHPILTQREAERLANVDYQTRMAFVATLEEAGEEIIVAVARYDVIRPDRPEVAEAAIVVEDRYQGQGLGSILLDRLLAYARAHGVRTFVAEISAENERMMRFVQRSGLPVEKKLEDRVWEVQLNIGGQG